jgi:hypothetical protein
VLSAHLNLVADEMREENRLTGGWHRVLRYISPYRFLPALRPSIDGYPRRCNARSIPSETQIPGLPSGSYFHSALFAVLIHSMAVGYFCAPARIKFNNELFAALFNELQARGDKTKLMQLFGH